MSPPSQNNIHHDILSGPTLDAASGQADSLIVFCHGYGANGADLIGLAPYWQKLLPNTAFAAPNAPEPCEAGGFGYQWFAIRRSADGAPDRQAMQSGVESAAGLLENFLASELARLGVEDQRLALVGFSQGTMMALHVGLRRKMAPAAICGYSGALPGAGVPEINPRPKILLVHGDSDPMVPAASTLDAAQKLHAAGFDVKHHISPGGGHSIMPDGLQLGGQFLAEYLKIIKEDN